MERRPSFAERFDNKISVVTPTGKLGSRDGSSGDRDWGASQRRARRGVARGGAGDKPLLPGRSELGQAFQAAAHSPSGMLLARRPPSSRGLASPPGPAGRAEWPALDRPDPAAQHGLPPPQARAEGRRGGLPSFMVGVDDLMRGHGSPPEGAWHPPSPSPRTAEFYPTGDALDAFVGGGGLAAAAQAGGDPWWGGGDPAYIPLADLPGGPSPPLGGQVRYSPHLRWDRASTPTGESGDDLFPHGIGPPAVVPSPGRDAPAGLASERGQPRGRSPPGGRWGVASVVGTLAAAEASARFPQEPYPAGAWRGADRGGGHGLAPQRAEGHLSGRVGGAAHPRQQQAARSGSSKPLRRRAAQQGGRAVIGGQLGARSAGAQRPPEEEDEGLGTSQADRRQRNEALIRSERDRLYFSIKARPSKQQFRPYTLSDCKQHMPWMQNGQYYEVPRGLPINREADEVRAAREARARALQYGEGVRQSMRQGRAPGAEAQRKPRLSEGGRRQAAILASLFNIDGPPKPPPADTSSSPTGGKSPGSRSRPKLKDVDLANDRMLQPIKQLHERAEKELDALRKSFDFPRLA